MATGALAEAFVAVKPDSSGFRAALLAQLKAATAGVSASIPVTVDTKAALASIAALRAAVGRLAEEKLKLSFVTAGDVYPQLVKLKRQFQRAGLADFLDINITSGQLVQQLLLLKKRIQAVGLSDTLAVNLDTSGVMAQIAALEASLAALPDVNIGVSTSGLGDAAAGAAGLAGALGPVAGAAAADSTALAGLAEASRTTAGAVATDTAAFKDLAAELASVQASTDLWKTSMAQAAATLISEQHATGSAVTDLDALATATDAVVTADSAVGRGTGFSALAAELASVQAATNLWDTSMAQAVATLSSEQSSAGAAVAGLSALAAAATRTAGSGGSGSGGGSGFLGAAAAGGFFGDALGALASHLKITTKGFATTFGSVAAWHVLVDLTAEAIISVGLALTAMATGVAAIAESGLDLGIHLEAVDTTAAALGVVIPPLTGKLDALAASMAPQAVELYGAALNIISSQSGVLLKAAGPVVTLFDDWAAKLVLWIQAQGEAGQLLKSGTAYLAQFGQIIGTLGEALGNLLKEDPGIAHYLLDIVGGAADVLKVFTALPAPIVAAVLALHGIYLWGNVLGSLLVKLATFVGSLGKSLLLMATNPFVWVAAAAAGLGYLAYTSTQADKSTKDFIANLNNGLANLNASTAILQIAADIGQVNAKIQASTLPAELNNWGLSFAHVGDQVVTIFRTLVSGPLQPSFFGALEETLKGVGDAFKDTFVSGAAESAAAAQQVSNNVADLNSELGKLMGQQGNLLHETGNLITQGYTYAESLSLMDLAGVKAGDSFDLMRVKVDNLITGYQDLSIRGGLLANSVNAVTFASLQQQEKVSALNSGWDAFETTIQAGETDLFKFNNTIVNLNGAFAKNSGQVTTLSKHQAGLIQYFTVAATQANTEMDSLTTLANAAALGSKGTDMLEQANKDLVASMLPAAKNSAAFTAILYALAQRGGYQGADSFEALTKWVGNVQDPMKNLSAITQTFTVKAGDLTKDVQNLSMALGTTLNNAMATAILAASGGQKVFDNFATSILTTKFNSDADQSSSLKLAQALQNLTGNTTDTKKEFISFAEDALHLTQTQADTLWNETFPKLQSSINSLHGTKIPISSVLSGSGDITMKEQVLGKNASGYLEFHAAGGLVGGSGGPTADTVPIMASSGEYVINARSAGALGTPFLNAMNGYAAGGLVSTVKDPWGLFGNWQATNAATWGGEIVKAGAQIAVDAYRAAVKAAAAKAGPGGSITPGVVSVAKYVLAHGGNKIAAAGIGGVIAGESGGNPEILEAGGGGGAGLLQWTPESSAAPYQPIITGNAGKDMATQLADMLYYIAGRGGMNSINNSGSAMAAAGVFSRMEGPAVPGSDIDSGVVLQLLADGYAGGGRVSKGGYAGGGMVTSFDKGGLLPPGLSMAWNGTGRAERVTPSGGDGELLREVRQLNSAMKTQNTLTQEQTAMVGQAPARTAKSMVRRVNPPLGGGWSRVGRPTA